MQELDELVQSPLNYTGGKYKLLPQMLPWFPEKIDTFVDLFCGGCNVGVNVKANKYIYNDLNDKLYGLFITFKNERADDIITLVDQIIDEYKLSRVSENGYDFYGCDSSKGVGAYNKEQYLQLRSDFNKLKVKDTGYYVILYVLMVFSFNNQIRFNSNNEFNLPVGKRDFNDKMRKKLIRFICAIKEQKAEFTNVDFRNFQFANLTHDDFVYADPPYLITCATYNEQNGWNIESEVYLLSILDLLNKRGIRFALSNVTESKGKKNDILNEWVNSKGYRIIDLDYSYNNANYHRKAKNSLTREVLIVNY